ncbi:MAG: hypothetical protein AAF806_19620 [Bacteroidota bacterium]
MKKVLFRSLTLLGFCLSLLVIFLLNPSLLYAHQDTYKNITIHHNGTLDEDLKEVIDLSLASVESAKIYQKDFKSQLCLNDGSFYPKLVQKILGDDVFTAFSNKIVVLGEPSDAFNRFYKWEQELRYDQFLSHALMHNLQFKHHGFFGANPLGIHPQWKWEGYVEYEILGKERDLENLITLLQNAPDEDFTWVDLGDGEKTVKRHLKYLVLAKYCFDVLDLSYDEFMENEQTEEMLYKEISKRF